MQSALNYAQEKAQPFLDQLMHFLRIPSISSQKDNAADVRRAAEWLLAELQSLGFTAELITAHRHPILYAEWLGAGPNAPTVLIYGHYDVQPAAKEEGWDNAPFDPTIHDGKLYARGATDDKGQLYAHVKAVEAILKTSGALPVNVKFLIEGEEEIGSAGVCAYVAQHPDRLSADVCLISDSSMGDIEQPVIVSGLRGIITMDVVVTGPGGDLHSGMYGGSVHNPAQALAEILAQLHDADGRVTVPGFYDDVQPLTPTEREEMARSPLAEVDWRRETGAPAPYGEPDYTLRERIGARPTLEINGIAGGYFGDGFKTVIPQKAWAKISCRLVPDQDPQRVYEQVAAHLAQITPPTVTLQCTLREQGRKAAVVDTSNPMMQAAVRAYHKGWGGQPPIFVREGGSIPIVSDFQEVLKAPVILMGFGLNTDNLHAPNEHFSVEMFYRGIRTSIHFLYELAQA